MKKFIMGGLLALFIVALIIGFNSRHHSTAKSATDPDVPPKTTAEWIKWRLAQPDMQSAPPEKIEAVKNTTLETLGPIEPGATLEKAFKDDGDPNEITLLETLIPSLLKQDLEIGSMGPYSAERPQQVRDGAEKRKETIFRIWGKESRDQVLENWENGLRLGQEDKSYSGYTSAKFEITKWQGIRVSGDSAFALAISHPSYSTGTWGWSPDPDRQLQVKLVKEDGTWKLAEKIEVEVPTN
jgi:hypothetical protein